MADHALPQKSGLGMSNKQASWLFSINYVTKGYLQILSKWREGTDLNTYKDTHEGRHWTWKQASARTWKQNCHCFGHCVLSLFWYQTAVLSLVSLEVMNSFCSKLIMRFKIYAVTFVEFLSYSSINIYIFKFPTKMINLMLPHMH